MVDPYDPTDPAMRGTYIFMAVLFSVLLGSMIIAGIVLAVKERSRAKPRILYQQTLPQIWKDQPTMKKW